MEIKNMSEGKNKSMRLNHNKNNIGGLPFPIIIGSVTIIAVFYIVNGDNPPLQLGVRVLNIFWLLFSAVCAFGSAFILYNGAKDATERGCHIFSAALYTAAAILCLELFIVLIRFAPHF
jgi:hypothetical protein